MTIRIVHYINQFFGQKGGEEAANLPIELVDGPVGPGGAIAAGLSGKAEIVKTIICGDSYFNENEAEASQGVREILENVKPDLLVAGPAFNAGRYGMACGRVGEVANELGIPAITGMYPENPGYELYRNYSYMIETSNSAAGMRKAIPAMVKLVTAFIEKEGKLGTPEEEGYMPRGLRVNQFAEERGAKRAVDMLLAKLGGQEFKTEYPMPVFDRVPPQPAVKDLSTATIALVTSGGVVPKHNPDHIESSSASKYGEYSLEGIDVLTEESHETAHGGYDPVACNTNPNRVLPVDVLREMEKEGKIGKLYETYYATVGNGTSVSNSKAFGAEIAMKLQKAGVTAAILTST
ncbi:Glycine reductase complex component B subunit gamma [invertebrate metagenome]|uniref:Glycine reductase complex component B subunit gamma n=1 Tax=invertebrate metagenome TaxID=1711999 RepID=A0A2H9T9Z3_9ZZZZ